MIDTIQFQKTFTKNGYIRIKVDKNWEWEHVWVVQQYIGRELENNEHVHHIDSNKLNNEIDNLVIFPNQNAHSHWHRQVKQFGITKPRLREIEQLKESMRLEHERNNKQ